MTKIVMVSDTHDRYGKFDMPEGDILLHAGDLTFHGKAEELARFNDWLDDLEFKHKIIVPGNHDLTFESHWDWAKAMTYAADAVLNGEMYEAEGFKIWGEPRQPWFHDWAFNVERENMKKVWDQIPPGIDILVTHGPPLGVGDLTPRGERVGCQYQRQWIQEYQPKLVVCGHIHNGYGLYQVGKTLVVNASVCDEHYEPVNKPIVIELIK